MSQISFEKFADGIDVNWTERAADGGRGDALCRRIVSANPISRSLSFPSIWLFPIIKRNCWSVALIRLYIFSSADMFCFWTLITILLRKDGWLQISQRETGLTTNIWTCRGPARLDITSNWWPAAVCGFHSEFSLSWASTHSDSRHCKLFLSRPLRERKTQN